MDRLILPSLSLFVVLIGAPCAHAEAPWQGIVTEAAQAHDIPAAWINAVIQIESNGNVRAVSPKGAMGLMQLMPETWADLREEHSLGDDPFDPRANIMAGAAYLGDLFDRFGYPALFAAYNAGPGRYDAYLKRGQPLPEETRRYVSAIDKALSSSREEPPSRSGTTGLFFRLTTHESPPSKASSSVTQGGFFIVRKGQGGGAP